MICHWTDLEYGGHRLRLALKPDPRVPYRQWILVISPPVEVPWSASLEKAQLEILRAVSVFAWRIAQENWEDPDSFETAEFRSVRHGTMAVTDGIESLAKKLRKRWGAFSWDGRWHRGRCS